jgi:REP element-mobilizing transposase RayT
MPVVLFAFVTWTTFRRMPMIGATEARFLERFLPAEAQRHGAATIRLGMVCDHVHMVLRLPARIDLPRMMQGLKGASARLANQDSGIARAGLRWAPGYTAISVSPRNVKATVAYVRRQPERHPERAIRR